MRHRRADGVTKHDSADAAGFSEIEYDDWQLVVHAEGNGRGVHDLQLPLEDLQIRNAWVFGGRRGEHRIGGVDAVDLGALQDELGLDLHGAQRGGGNGLEIRVAAAGGEDDDAACVQVTG